MTLVSKFVGKFFSLVMRLPPARARGVTVQRDIAVPMPDGVTLLADHYAPEGTESAPAVLIRSPYGRTGPLNFVALMARLMAERGYHVVLQSTRGTFGSGGPFEPFIHEASDGRATLDWVAAQPWFSGSLGLWGLSYLGITQWAVAADAPPFVKALVPQVTSSFFWRMFYRGGAFDLESALLWAYIVSIQEGSALQFILGMAGQKRALEPGYSKVPLRGADAVVTGSSTSFFDTWISQPEPDAPYWKALDFSGRVGDVSAPVFLTAGWYDLFLPDMLSDYAALKRAGRAPHLTVGPWTHRSVDLALTLRESLDWLDVHLRGDSSRLRPKPVRVFVMGSRRWLDLESWPPPHAPTRWHLQPRRGLAKARPPESPPDAYRYDPRDPTPSVGGTSLSADAGPKDNRELEARADVISYTSEQLEEDLEIIGPVTAELFVTSSLQHTDFFARLCDVHPSGKSINICDGITRLAPIAGEPPPEGPRRVQVELFATAHTFLRGHRLRLQVSSGAHPRHNRNFGSGEPLADATTWFAADQRVYHDPARPSAVILPVFARG